MLLLWARFGVMLVEFYVALKVYIEVEDQGKVYIVAVGHVAP